MPTEHTHMVLPNLNNLVFPEAAQGLTCEHQSAELSVFARRVGYHVMNYHMQNHTGRYLIVRASHHSFGVVASFCVQPHDAVQWTGMVEGAERLNWQVTEPIDNEAADEDEDVVVDYDAVLAELADELEG